MANSNGIFSQRGKIAGSEIKANFCDKEQDLMEQFRHKKAYSWYFNEVSSSKKRFTPQKKKQDFDTLMLA
jgi:hypothetical protein